MGVNFYVGTIETKYRASWSYLGFGDFRRKLVESVGYKMLNVEGTCSWVPVDKETKKQLPWKVLGGLAPLINHPDNEGLLTPKQCARVFPVLDKIVKFWTDTYDKTEGLKLVAAMKECVRKNKPLVFS